MTTSTTPGRATFRTHRSRWLALLALVVGLAVGATLTAVITTRTDDDSSRGSAAQLSQVQASCRAWTDSSEPAVSEDQWCTDMFAWMSSERGGSMMGSRMWQGPEQLSTSCRRWVDEDAAASGSSGQQRCDDMVEWMDDHMSSRGGNWMMHDR